MTKFTKKLLLLLTIASLSLGLQAANSYPFPGLEDDLSIDTTSAARTAATAEADLPPLFSPVAVTTAKASPERGVPVHRLGTMEKIVLFGRRAKNAIGKVILRKRRLGTTAEAPVAAPVTTLAEAPVAAPVTTSAEAPVAAPVTTLVEEFLDAAVHDLRVPSKTPPRVMHKATHPAKKSPGMQLPGCAPETPERLVLDSHTADAHSLLVQAAAAPGIWAASSTPLAGAGSGAGARAMAGGASGAGAGTSHDQKICTVCRGVVPTSEEPSFVHANSKELSILHTKCVRSNGCPCGKSCPNRAAAESLATVLAKYAQNARGYDFNIDIILDYARPRRELIFSTIVKTPIRSKKAYDKLMHGYGQLTLAEQESLANALISAVEKDETDCALALITPETANSIDRSGDPVLSIALKKCNEHIVRALLANDANPNIPNSNGHYPLVQAAYLYPNEAIFRLLLGAKSLHRDDAGLARNVETVMAAVANAQSGQPMISPLMRELLGKHLIRTTRK
jgi:hypothetical protein